MNKDKMQDNKKDDKRNKTEVMLNNRLVYIGKLDKIDKMQMARAYAEAKAKGEMTPEFLEYIIRIMDIINSKLVDPPEWKEDLKQEALLHILKYWKSCDETKPATVFSYFYQVCLTALASAWKKIFKNKDGIVFYSLNIFDDKKEDI